MIRRVALCCLLFQLSACSSLQKALPPALTAPEDPLPALETIFSQRLSKVGSFEPDREVIEVTPDFIRYYEQGEKRHLLFKDIAVVDREIPLQAEREIETLRLYLREGSASVNSAVATGAPFGLGRPNILLASRPRGSYQRLRSCLDQLKKRRLENNKTEAPSAPPVSPKTEAPKTIESKPKSLSSDEIEERLERLKTWSEKGLITKEEYDQKRKKLLDKY